MRLAELFDLGGKNAIVTGGGSGLGRHFAEGLAEAGANLLICGRNIERCEEAATALRAEHGVTVLAHACDVRDPDQVERAVARGEKDLGPIDVLVNNAGTSWGAPAEHYPLDGWRKVIEVNLTGTFLFAQAVGRGMLQRGEGSIINVASVAAFGGAPAELMDAVGYNASKGGCGGVHPRPGGQVGTARRPRQRNRPGLVPVGHDRRPARTVGERIHRTYPARPLRRRRRPQGRSRLPRL